MRIAQVAPLTEAVPPKLYGGTERVVHWLTEELVALGHDVTLFATGDSKTSAKLRYIFEHAQTPLMHQPRPYTMHIAEAYRHVAEEAKAGRPYDLVHDHTAWLSLGVAPLLPTPVVHTLHGAAVPDGTSVIFTTDLGFFLESGLSTVSKVTVGGFADVTLASLNVGAAHVKAIWGNE